MAEEESDGIDEGIDDGLRGVSHVAMTAAARAGEQLARMREQQARDAQARSEQPARELANRIAAECDAARASLAPVYRAEWWDSAHAEDVTKVFQTAKAWADVDPEAARAEQQIIEQVRNRCRVDVTGDSHRPRRGRRSSEDSGPAARRPSSARPPGSTKPRRSG